ncbi:type II toxin-antitoxin system HicB family antitoxin [Synechocystis salina LEGE 06155]|nr:type II toxin-antitoxin system HicB family antitoxin [Synechocystis salina LEGE 06155]
MEHQFFTFPAHFEPDQMDGGFVITFRDVPEAITQADTYEQGISEASDCLAEAIAAYIDDRRHLPVPSLKQQGEELIPVPLEIAWKAELYSKLRDQNLTISQLASKLGEDKRKIESLIDPHYSLNLTLARRVLKILNNSAFISNLSPFYSEC